MTNPLEGLDGTLAAEFAQIRQAFIAGLPQRLQRIRAAESKQVLHLELHRLAGAAGGYGLERLDQLARAALQAVHGDEPALLQQRLQALADAIEGHGAAL